MDLYERLCKATRSSAQRRRSDGWIRTLWNAFCPPIWGGAVCHLQRIVHTPQRRAEAVVQAEVAATRGRVRPEHDEQLLRLLRCVGEVEVRTDELLRGGVLEGGLKDALQGAIDTDVELREAVVYGIALRDRRA
jgi:hypothetical protein